MQNEATFQTGSAGRLRRIFWFLFTTTALIIGGIVAGRLAGTLPPMVTAILFAGMLALLITLIRPDLALYLYFCGIVMTTDDNPEASADFFFIPDADIIQGLPSALTTFFLLMLGVTVLRILILRQQRMPVSLLPAGVYTVILFMSLLTGLRGNPDIEIVRVDFVGMLFPVMCFYLCLIILNSRERIARMLALLLAVSAIKALILAAFYLKGRGWIYGLDSITLYRVATMDSADLLVFITLPLVAVHLIVRRDIRGFSTGLTAAACIPLLYVIIFSYRRAQWVGMIFSTGLLYLGASKYVRGKMVLLLLVTLLIGVAVAVSAGLNQEKAGHMIARLTSVFDKNQSSNVYHVLESRQVLKELAGSPLLGLGLGSEHAPLGLYEEDEVPANVVHNTFLYIWMKTGLPGLLFFLWAAVIYARRVLRCRNEHPDGSSWPLLLPLAASAGLWLAMFLTGPVPWYLHQTGLIALFAAMGMSLILQAEQNNEIMQEGCHEGFNC
jgi:O-antigen ligase